MQLKCAPRGVECGVCGYDHRHPRDGLTLPPAPRLSTKKEQKPQPLFQAGEAREEQRQVGIKEGVPWSKVGVGDGGGGHFVWLPRRRVVWDYRCVRWCPPERPPTVGGLEVRVVDRKG